MDKPKVKETVRAEEGKRKATAIQGVVSSSRMQENQTKVRFETRCAKNRKVQPSLYEPASFRADATQHTTRCLETTAETVGTSSWKLMPPTRL